MRGLVDFGISEGLFDPASGTGERRSSENHEISSSHSQGGPFGGCYCRGDGCRPSASRISL